MHALVVVYGLRGIDAAAHTELADQLAPALEAVPGLVSWTRLQNTATGRYGAFYLFESKTAFDRFVASELYGAAHGHEAVIAVAASDFAIPNGRGNASSLLDLERFLSVRGHGLPMPSRVEELEAIRERLAELEGRLDALEGARDPETARGGLSRLSETERRIVGLVVAGGTNDEVAQRLFLSPKTVEWSLTKIYRKLLVRSRTELAAKLLPAESIRGDSGETPGQTLSGSQSEAQAEDGGEAS